MLNAESEAARRITVHTKDRITFNLTCGDGFGPGEIETETQTAWRSASSEAGRFFRDGDLKEL